MGVMCKDFLDIQRNNMTEKCSKCGGTNISSGSWTPSRCMTCGAIEAPGCWYYDDTAQPYNKDIRVKSGYVRPKRKRKPKHKPEPVSVWQDDFSSYAPNMNRPILFSTESLAILIIVAIIGTCIYEFWF